MFPPVSVPVLPRAKWSPPPAVAAAAAAAAAKTLASDGRS